MKKLVLLLCISISVTCAMAQEPNTAPTQPSVTLPSELDRVLRDYEAAWSAKDAARLARLFAEDGYVLAGGAVPQKGRVAIEAYYTGHGGPLFLRAFAYATEGKTGYIIGGYSGKPNSPDEGKFTLTLKKGIDGRWLIFSDMDNMNRRPQGPQRPPTPQPE